MHDGDHDILGSHESHGDHDHSHDHKHDHDHHEEDANKRKSNKAVKVIAGLVSVGLIVVFVLWKLV